MKATFKFEDVFSVTGRGVVITGRIVEGNIDKTCLILMGDKRLSISGIEMFRKLMEEPDPVITLGFYLVIKHL